MVAAAETFRQFDKTSAREEDGVVADAQHLLLGVGGQIARIVGECTHVCGGVHQVVVAAAETFR